MGALRSTLTHENYECDYKQFGYVLILQKHGDILPSIETNKFSIAHTTNMTPKLL